MNRSPVIILLLFTCLLANAQQSTFSKVIWDVSQLGISESAVTQAVGNGYILAGGGLIVKIDSAANPVWNRTVGGNAVFNDVSSTNDSCYILAGTITNSSNTYNDALCVKINGNGNVLWAKQVSCGGNLTVYSIKQTKDLGYVMTGYLSSSGTPNSRVFVAKLNSTGNLQWSNVLAAGNYSNDAYCIRQTQDNGFVITGSYVNDPPYSKSIFLIKLTSSGVFSWAKNYPSAYNVTNLEIVNNGFMFYLSSGFSTGIMKTDISGNVLWSKEYSMSPWSGMGFVNTKIHKTSDKCFVFIVGSCGGSSIAKIDSVGNLIWTKHLLLNAVDVLETKDKGFFITGNGPMCGVKTSAPFTSHIGTIKTDSLCNASNCVYNNGYAASTYSITASAVTFTSSSSGATITTITPVISSKTLSTDLGCVSIIGAVAENELQNSISVSPNPAGGMFHVAINQPGNLKIGSIEIYTVYGEKVYSSILSSQSLSISPNVPGGIYFMHVKIQDVSGNYRYIVKKIVKE